MKHVQQFISFVATVLLYGSRAIVGDRFKDNVGDTIGVLVDFIGIDDDDDGRDCLKFEALIYPSFEMRRRFVLHAFHEALSKPGSVRVYRWLEFEKMCYIIEQYANGVKDESPYRYAFCNVRDSSDWAIEFMFDELMKAYGDFLHNKTMMPNYASFIAHEMKHGPLDTPDLYIDPFAYGIYKKCEVPA